MNMFAIGDHRPVLVMLLVGSPSNWRPPVTAIRARVSWTDFR